MNEIKIRLPIFIVLVALLIIGGVVGVRNILNNNNFNNEVPNNNISTNVNSGENRDDLSSNIENSNDNESITGNEGENNVLQEEESNGLSKFDLDFLKLENQNANKIYSPLSIKYALKMLEEGTTGNSKTQISSVIGNTKLTKYKSNSNMSLANALFIKDSFKENIKESYMNALKEKYDAEVKFDSFEMPDNVNSWISDKTLNLINNLLSDISGNEFLLVNALGIDMEWKEKFLKGWEESHWSYAHENFWGSAPTNVSKKSF